MLRIMLRIMQDRQSTRDCMQSRTY
ncbi:hypothetical protein A1UA_05342, partial [Escherichia coli KTE69]